MTDKIYLVGFMASGKSTIARALASRLRWRAEDVDELIEQRERTTIAQVFATHGEPYFRSVEREILKVLQPLRHLVVATGGGTFADPDNRAAINLDGVSVWIDVPLADLIPRIPLDGRRPLAANRRRARAALRRARGRVPHGAHPHHRVARERGGGGRTHSRDAAPVAALLRTIGHDRLTPVRYLVLTDLHANLHALDAVLADAAASATTRCSCLGDLVGYGADPGAGDPADARAEAGRAHPRATTTRSRRASSPRRCSTRWPGARSNGRPAC